jgi:uncharacterized protein (TIGR01777 family)
MAKHILLTGGSGLIGKNLTNLLLSKGYIVSHLSRKPENNSLVKTYLWNVNKSQIDENCIKGVNIIVHLAGAGIAEKRWTKSRKKELIESRTKSIGLIYNLLKNKTHHVEAVISAAATGYYNDRGDELLTEDSPPSNDFLAHCCIQWEHAVDKGKDLGLRILKFRTGVVLSADGGALSKMAGPVKLGLGSPLGNGQQWIPWIHHEDVVNLYLYGIENTKLQGVFNMVAPNPVTNAQLTKAIARQLHKPLWLPNVPAFVLKLLLGEMSTIVLGSSKASAQKIEQADFKFKYATIENALANIYS